MATFYYIISFLLVLALIGWGIDYAGRRNAENAKLELHYDMKYYCINSFIDTWEVNEKNYNVLWRMIWDLEKLPHQNNEKLEILKNKFLEKYQAVSRDILSQDEFDLVNTFGE